MVTKAKLSFFAPPIHKQFLPVPVLRIWNDFSPCKEEWFIYEFRDGIATFVAYSLNSLETLSELVDGCFEKRSNFKKVLFQALALPSNTLFVGLRIIYKGTIILITPYSKGSLIESYISAKNFPKSENFRTVDTLPWIHWQSLGLTRKEFVKKVYRSHIVQAKIDQVSQSTELLFKNSEEKILWHHLEDLLKYPENSALSMSIIPFAKRFATWTQYLMAKCNKPFYDIANYAMKSGYMDSIDFVTLWRAMEVLSHSWKYGDELSYWFEKRYKLPCKNY